MKKDVLKQVLIIAGAVALVMMLIGFIQAIASFDDFISLSQYVGTIGIDAEDYIILYPYVLTSFILNILTLIVFIALPFLKFIRQNKTKKILTCILLGLIAVACVTSCILSRVAGTKGLYDYYYNHQYYTGIHYTYYLYYQTNLTSVLAFTIPALILLACVIAYKFIEKKESKETDTNAEEKATENEIEDTKKDGE